MRHSTVFAGLSVITLMTLFSGCVHTQSVTYRSDPAGATVFCEGENLGTEPVTLHFEASEKIGSRRRYHGKPVTLLWPDGYRRTVTGSWVNDSTMKPMQETVKKITLEVEYKTRPEGGVVFLNGKEVGTKIAYPITDNDSTKGFLAVPPVTIKWPDGNEKIFPAKTYSVSRFDGLYIETIEGIRTATVTYNTRPTGAALYRDGKSLGKAPLTVSRQTWADEFSCPEITAKWDAGYERVFPAKSYTVYTDSRFEEIIEPHMFEITYMTDPPGATLFAGDKRALGTSPVTVCHPLIPSHLADNSIALAPVTAAWPDGSRQTTVPETYDLNASNPAKRTIKRVILEVTYCSDPPGASISEGEEYLGVAPVTLLYPVDEQELADGVRRVPNITARWISGAETTTKDNKITLKGSLSATRSLVRPMNMPDREADIAYSLELDRIKLEHDRVRMANALEKDKMNLDRQIEKDRLVAEQKNAQERLNLEREIERDRRSAAARQHAAELAQAERERQMRASQIKHQQNTEAANAAISTGMNLLRLAR